MDIETIHRIELGDLISFIAESRDREYEDIENCLPFWVFEDGAICDDATEEIFTEVTDYLEANDIDSVMVYQD